MKQNISSKISSMRNLITLDDLPINTKGYVSSLNCDGNIRRRLLDLGLVKNSSITPVLVSPSGDPRAFELRRLSYCN